MLRIVMLATILTLVACSAPPSVLPPVKAPENTLTRCDKLPSPRMGDHFESYLDAVIDAYYVCAIRHDALVEFNK